MRAEPAHEAGRGQLLVLKKLLVFRAPVLCVAGS